jgi:hypothetical protein
MEKHTIKSHLASEDYETLKRCEICFPATAPLNNRIAELEAQVTSLTAANAAMQEDAVQNTYAFNLMLEANRSQAAEIVVLKERLEFYIRYIGEG